MSSLRLAKWYWWEQLPGVVFQSAYMFQLASFCVVWFQNFIQRYCRSRDGLALRRNVRNGSHNTFSSWRKLFSGTVPDFLFSSTDFWQLVADIISYCCSFQSFSLEERLIQLLENIRKRRNLNACHAVFFNFGRLYLFPTLNLISWIFSIVSIQWCQIYSHALLMSNACFISFPIVMILYLITWKFAELMSSKNM